MSELTPKSTSHIFSKIKSMLDNLIYSYRLLSWRFLNRYRFLLQVLIKLSDSIRRAVILIIALVTAYTVIQLVDLHSLKPEALSTYFISAGAMAGGIIAIVFTLSIFAQQGAADLYSSQYFEVYTYDWKEKFIYLAIIIITIFFFGAGIWLNSNPELANPGKVVLIYSSLFAAGLIFTLIDWQYKNVRAKINPLNALSFLENEAICFLRRLHKDGVRIAKIIQSKNKDISEQLALASTYNSYLQPHLSILDRQIENLFEISMKLSNRQEIMTTNRGITAAHNIIRTYFDFRKTSSLALPSQVSIFAIESDSGGFLAKSLERLNKVGESFIKERKIENAVHIIDIYRSLAIKSREIGFINKEYENPIFSQIQGYLDFYILFAIREKDQEVVLQGARTFRQLALVAVEKKLQTSLTGLQDNLLNIALFGITEKKTFIIDECYVAWLAIMEGIFYYQFFGADHQISKTLKNITTITTVMQASISTGFLAEDFSTSTSLCKPYDEMMAVIGRIVDTYFKKLTTEDAKRFYRAHLIDLFENLYRVLRDLSEKSKTCDTVLADSIGRLIFDLNSLIVKLLEEGEFDDYRRDLEQRLEWNIYLPYWFVHHSKQFKASHAFNVLTEPIIKTAILLFENQGSGDVIIDCVKAMYSIVKQALEKISKGHGYDEPRLMVRLSYLGILALKYNKQDILTEIGIRIYEFERLYEKKYFSNLPPGIDLNKVSPRKDQLFLEIFNWRDDFDRDKYDQFRFRDNSSDLIIDLIDEVDIDRFMFEVWGQFPGDSPIKQEIEERLLETSRNHQIKRLIEVMQRALSVKKQNLNLV
ncbi:MAG TPA: hypothetical protein VNJ29_00270 [Candidatus Nitrosotenuis sp.]|nr:hypothetical protein [Candidatus Nitrosotenuis sp.]